MSHTQSMAQIYIRMLYATSHQTLLDRSKVKLLPSDAEPASPRQPVICYSPHMKAPLASSCLTPSKMTAGFQQAELFVTKQIVTNLWDKYRIARPPCFNLSFFLSFVSIIEMNKWTETMVCFILNEACSEWIFHTPAVCLWWVLTGDPIPARDVWMLD